MDSLRKLLPKRARRTYEADPKYELLHAAETDQPEPSLCTRCGNAAHASITAQSARLRIALQVTISLAVLALWTALVGFYLASNPHLLQQHRGPRSLADLFPMVQVDFQPDHRFVDSDPYDTPFWDPGSGLTDAMASNAWNYYGNDWIYLEKGSPYAIPGGRPLVPLHEENAWMADYLAYLPAYKHEIHCLGVIKHTLNSYRDGKNVTAGDNDHANKHCVEVVRHALMCNPDFTLAVPTWNAHGEEKELYWGGEKHMCRDQKKVHAFMASRNMGFEFVEGGGREIVKAWAWPLPTDTVGW
ncbi:hypothetical protein PMIN07_006504 [Paraphaeosphaeria minitans]